MDFQNDLGFSLYIVLSMCHLVPTPEGETEFKRECSDRMKCVILTPEFSINSSWNYSRLSDWKLQSIY